MRFWRLGLVAAAASLSGCPAVSADPPPPPRLPEIAVAPPHALGALAAGTDAAPHPEATPGGEVEPDAPVPPSAAPDAGAPAPVPGAATPPAAPDAGMAL
jgi:preprotein translocase subunit SecD